MDDFTYGRPRKPPTADGFSCSVHSMEQLSTKKHPSWIMFMFAVPAETAAEHEHHPAWGRFCAVCAGGGQGHYTRKPPTLGVGCGRAVLETIVLCKTISVSIIQNGKKTNQNLGGHNRSPPVLLLAGMACVVVRLWSGQTYRNRATRRR